jgi:hypothetical protein
MTYLLTIQTKRLFGKPKVELFKGDWKSEKEVKQVVAKFRPKAEILSIERIIVVSNRYHDVEEFYSSNES